jgi:hypothetical protein
MADAASPYGLVAGRLRDMGYHAMSAKPGEKVPGHFEAGRWSHMARWQDWCGRMPPEFLHERWESWPDPGVCIARNAGSFGLPLQEGSFVARLGGMGFAPLATPPVQLHEGIHFVRGQVDTP